MCCRASIFLSMSPRSLDFYIRALCSFIASLPRAWRVADDSKCPGGHPWGEVRIHPSNEWSLQSVFSALLIYLFWIPSFISLCHGRSLCFAQYCLAPGHTWSDIPPPSLWQPYTKPAHRCAPAPTDMHVNKHKHTSEFPPFSLQAHTPIPKSLPPLTSLRSFYVFIINLVPDLFLTFRVFPFDIQIDLFTGSPPNKKNRLAESNLVTNSSPSMPTPLYLMLGTKEKAYAVLWASCLCIIASCSPERGWGGCARRRRKRVMGWQEVVFLVKLICTPRWGGEEGEVQMEKCLVGGVGGGDGGWDIGGGTSRCW